MIYTYRCKVCGKVIEVQQGIDDEHKYEHCGQQCARVFEVKQVKKNEGFYSVQLGMPVSGQAEYNEQLERWRYVNGLNKYLGNNATPKDEWIEEKNKRDRQRMEHQTEEEARAEEEYYGQVKTFE